MGLTRRQAGPNPAAGTSAPLATKREHRWSSPPCPCEKVNYLSVIHALTLSFPTTPVFTQSFWLQES